MIGTHIGKYRIVRQLGVGGMAHVYEAQDELIGRTVALKVLVLPSIISESERLDMVRRFEREARSAGKLSHPNIVTIYEVGSANGMHYIAMEFMHGKTAREVLNEEGKIPPDRVLNIVKQVASALDYAHARGVVHRDVKPDNIALLEDGIVKLTDFGIARLANDLVRTQAGIMVGSPAYMSPEQIVGDEVDGRSDVFSLGVTTYELLTGSKPFEASTITAVMHKIIYEQPAPAEDLSPAVERVLRKALEKEPAKRYQSARAFAEDLGLAMLTSGVQGDTDIFHARPQSQPELEKTVITRPAEDVPVSQPRRRWGWVAGIVSVVVAIAAVGAWMVLSGNDGQWRQYLVAWGILSGGERSSVSAFGGAPPVSAKPIGATFVLSDFEIALGGWRGEKDTTVLQRVRGGASQGAYWLKVMSRSLEFEPALVVRLEPETSDWSRFGDTLALDIFLPIQVSVTCRATVVLVDTQGRESRLPQPVTLRPGLWVNVEWRAGDLLRNVKELRVEIENLPVGDSGWFGIDYLRVYRTQ
ncbi:MAG: serine/threonine protein kinase [Chthonomonadetes bacterium]|nr:serine/threonine protein kinase [Chthonomonadetes bacterium]